MIVKIDDENFNTEVLLSKKVVVVKLYTEHCSNCLKIASIFKLVATTNSLEYKFCEWEVINHSDILSKYKVMAVPTLLFFKNGLLINRRVGVLSEKRILKYLNKISSFNNVEVENNELRGLIDWSSLKFWKN